jgi:hypothetical protein
VRVVVAVVVGEVFVVLVVDHNNEYPRRRRWVRINV